METVVLVEGGSQLIPLQIYTVSICHYVTCDICHYARCYLGYPDHDLPVTPGTRPKAYLKPWPWCSPLQSTLTGNS